MSTSALPTPATAGSPSSSTSSLSSTPAGASAPVPHVTSRRLADLVASVHPGTKLEPELEAVRR